MPVQVPIINRAPVQQQQSVGRIDYKPIDVVQPLRAQTAAIEKFGAAGVEVYDAVQKNTADTEAIKASSDYHKALLEQLLAAKSIKGDPTKAYEEYDRIAKEKSDEILNKYNDSSDIVKTEVAKKLNETGAKFYDRKATAFATQLNTYQNAVTNDAIKIAKDDMMDSVAHLDISDPNATAGLDAVIGKIENLRLKNGEKNGTVKPVLDPKGEIDPATGKVKVIGYEKDPIVTLQLKQDLNDGISKTILNLSAAGDVEGAEFLKKKYSSYLTTDSLTKIENTTKKESIRQKGNNVFEKTRGMSEERAVKFIDAVADPEVRRNAMAAYSAYHSQMKRQLTQAANSNYEQLAKYLQNKDINSVHELESDPFYKRISSNLTAKQIDALHMRIEQPKISNPEVKQQAFQAMFDGKLKGMSVVDYDQLTAGLSKSDKAKMDSKYLDFNSQTPGEQNQMVKYMGTQLTKELNKSGIIKRNAFGKYNNDDLNKITQANDELLEAMDKFPPGFSMKEQNDFVQKFVADKIKQQAFSPPTTVKPVITKPKTEKDKIDTSNVGGVKPKMSELEAKKAFFRANERFPNAAELKEFMEANK